MNNKKHITEITENDIMEKHEEDTHKKNIEWVSKAMIELESGNSAQDDVGSRLFAVMADEYVILKLFWKKEDAEKELEVYKREHKDALYFVNEVDVH